MILPDVFQLRQTFMQQQIMLCFNGPFTATLIDEIGKALRKHMQSLDESESAVTDVFSVYIEMTQNIRSYHLRVPFSGAAATSTIIVCRSDEGHYIVSAGNVVRREDGLRLQQRINELSRLDKGELKLMFKSQLRTPREELGNNSAGLGLIDMARKATAPLSCDLRSVDAEHSFFCLHVTL